MADSFYPFVENGGGSAPDDGALVVRHPARIAVFDDPAAAPRVVVVEPKDIRSYLEEITATVTRLAAEQGGRIPFTVIREVVENLIHAYFLEPTVSILDGGNTIRFSDQGPGIADKDRALEYGTTSATTEMKRYIRGVGSGLPYAQQWLEDKGGSLTVEDNIHQGTVVTISLAIPTEPQGTLAQVPEQPLQQGFYQQVPSMMPTGVPAGSPMAPQGGWPQQAWPQPQQSWPQQQGWPQPQQAWPQGYPQQAVPGYAPMPPQAAWGATPPSGAWPAQPQPTPIAQTVGERGALILEYLRSHESVGPRDLNAWHPLSESTWSRELARLEQQGLVAKQGGQKRYLTAAGRQLLGL